MDGTMCPRGRRAASADLDPVWNDEIEGLVRCHVFDPFGNRVELIDADTIVSDKP